MDTQARENSHTLKDPSTFKGILIRAIVLPLILLALVTGLFLWQIRRLLDTVGWVEHTDQVIASANNSQKLLLDMETGFRGYVITGQQEFLQPYNQASQLINPSLSELRQLVSDNPTQVQRIEAVSSEYRNWNTYAKEVIAGRATSGGEVQARVSSGEGKRIMDGMRSDFAAFIAEEEVLRNERTANSKSATRRTVASTLLVALFLGAGLAVFIRRQLMAASNIYRQALTDEQLQREWLGTILASIGDAVIATDHQGKVILMNGVAQSITGWTNSEAAGVPLEKVFNIVNEETRAEVESPVVKVLREGQIVGLANHTILIAKDGSEVPIDDSGAPIKDPQGHINGVVLVFRDITERKQSESELVESERRLRRAITESPIPMIIHDENDNILEISKGWTKESGYGLEDTPTVAAWTAKAYGNNEPIIPDIDQFFLANETVSCGEKTVTTANGNERIWNFFTTPLGKTTSGVRLLLSIGVDITDSKHAARERERLLERETTLRSEAEDANRLKDEFFSNASHELRTPLNAIVGWTRMLRRGTLNAATASSALETIERSANAQTKLIEDLLDVSRIITGKLKVEMHPTEVGPVISSAVNSLRPAATAKEISIATHIENQAWPVLADVSRLQQVVWNLLSNAVKFTPRGGRIEISLARVEHDLELSVRDTGEGIEPEFLPYVFDRFRQADGTRTRRHGGLGLGLAIVRNLVEIHGGMVTAYSEGLGKGATFVVRLPLLDFAPQGSTPVSSPGQTRSQQPIERVECPPRLEGIRVLVVDDDSDAREMLNTVLTQCEAEVTTAASTREALEEIARQRPDVLVSDIGMPDLDGYELIKRLRQSEAAQGQKGLPALALTAYAKAEDRVRALAAGYHVHLSKPVDPEEFALVVASLLGRGTN